MVNVCWQCGDIGISEALVYCIKCRSAASHSYCLENVPEDLTAEINWFCEDCRSKSPSSASKAKFPPLTSPGILDHGCGIPQLGPKNPCQEIGSSDDCLVNSQDQHLVSNAIIGAIGSSVYFKLEKGERDRYRKDPSENRSLILPIEDKFNSLHPVIDRRGVNMKCAVKRLPDFSVEPADTIRLVDTEAQIKLSCQLSTPSLPVVPHVWSGCFNINKVEFGPLRGHLSSNACLKVCNLVRKLPLALHMQKLPRLVAWPNSFKGSCPTVDNVALYFFAESDRVETVFNDLVDDIINNDLMLRFEFDEVELLIFSSFVLPYEHQRFFGKYYPWGVFKPRSAMICSLPTGSHTGYQVGETLKCVRRVEPDNNDDGQFKYSAQKNQ